VKTALNPRSSEKLQFEGRGEISAFNVVGCFEVCRSSSDLHKHGRDVTLDVVLDAGS
jgi:hypothetical protein